MGHPRTDQVDICLDTPAVRPADAQLCLCTFRRQGLSGFKCGCEAGPPLPGCLFLAPNPLVGE